MHTQFVLKSGMLIKKGPTACSMNMKDLEGLKGYF